ncbi:hypothetical protein [Shewanella aestuarii]|uniref:Uncharacterized protein n=1 Tax=Shewanella aestuarii TaxID=1028752 RepID=A0A6G9QMR8_9GAMM|nr:hypothetical protein [Shewanella aestuarii]QIR15365.1 hypothetical protein HBH39_13410 [Shewanella aestuarii]
MNKPFSYSYDITLDKNYFSETYDASVNPKLTAKDFIKTGIFALIGFAILLSSSMGTIN